MNNSCRKAKVIIKGLDLDPSRVGILELDEMGEEGAAIQVSFDFNAPCRKIKSNVQVY